LAHQAGRAAPVFLAFNNTFRKNDFGFKFAGIVPACSNDSPAFCDVPPQQLVQLDPFGHITTLSGATHVNRLASDL
jgi:hypothetical protein